MNHSDEFRRCLEDCDIVTIRRLWKHISPNLEQPTNDRDALISIHIARTQSSSITFRLRAYSHRWLLDNDLPSMLPDNLRPRAERIYPRIVEGVGISINTTSSIVKPALPIIQKSMSDAVLECYIDKKTDVPFIKQKMHDARVRTIHKLFGQTSL